MTFPRAHNTQEPGTVVLVVHCPGHPAKREDQCGRKPCGYLGLGEGTTFCIHSQVHLAAAAVSKLKIPEQKPVLTNSKESLKQLLGAYVLQYLPGPRLPSLRKGKKKGAAAASDSVKRVHDAHFQRRKQRLSEESAPCYTENDC